MHRTQRRHSTRLPTVSLLLLLGCGESWSWTASGPGPGGAGTDTAADPAHDLDGDGFAGTTFGGDDCWDDPASIPEGFTAVSGTAQPAAADVHPGAAEAWYDGVDQDCGGDDDFDQDGDGHRSQVRIDGSGKAGDDCYDAVNDGIPEGASSCTRTGDLLPVEVHPGATDAAYDGVDADCSGNDDFDQDADGYGRCAECDDTNAAIYPNEAPDSWYDGVDSNCDGNDGDQDGDGYYDAGYAFAIPADYQAGDCVDDPTAVQATLNGFPSVDALAIHPGAAETWYDGVDADCAGDDDFDQDVDGQDTTAWPSASGVVGPDCVDTDGTVFAGATDAWYDGVDSDCAGNDDYDQDGDGYDAGVDCDDLDFATNPGEVEDCATAADDDCSGTTNDTDATGCVAYSPDLDGDGYGDLDGAACLCAPDATYTVSGVTSADADCDDVDSTVNPGETEVCNDGVDNDCDGGAGGCALKSISLGAADAKFTGEATGDDAGNSISRVGDVNGDGFDDVLIGANFHTDSGAQSGAAYLLLGSPSPSSISLSAADARFTGEASGDRAGESVAGAGDVDGDGFYDLLIGALGNDDGGSWAGAGYLLLGSTSPSSRSLSAADAKLTGESADGLAGYVSPAGDVNGDGLSDILVGKPKGTDGGAVYLILGSASPASIPLAFADAKLTGEGADDRAGYALAAAGDVDGDGLGDVLVGAYMNDDGGLEAGAAYLMLGSTAPGSGPLAAAATQFTGVAGGDQAGISVSTAGDVNGDGFDDVLVGAPEASSGLGTAYLVLGAATPSTLRLDSADAKLVGRPDDYAGASVSTAGDVDGDGFADMLIGAHMNSGSAYCSGAAYLVMGASSPASVSLSAAQAEFTGEDALDYAGRSVATAGDLNGDGVGDLLVGAFGHDSSTGAAYLILGQGI